MSLDFLNKISCGELPYFNIQHLNMQPFSNVALSQSGFCDCGETCDCNCNCDCEEA